MKNKFIYVIIGILLPLSGFCIELDTSIDAEINKTYNTEKLEDTLPKLPSGLEPNTPIHNSASISTTPIKQTVKEIPIKSPDRSAAIKISRGTKFRTCSKNWASDSAKIGNRINFTTTKPISKRYITIPAGSTINGRITDAHLPQYAGNGGLIKIEIESITIAGANHYADGKITKANGKKIFFNNIKGKRTYLANTGQNLRKSHQFFRKSMKKTSEFANDGLTAILSPFTFIGGTVGYIGGIVLSPVAALKAKGNRISLPPDTLYEIKLTQDLYIYN